VKRPAAKRIPRTWAAWGAWVTWLGALAGATLLMVLVRERLGEAHVALTFMVVVLAGSAAAGRPLGFTLAGLAFLAFNFLFLPPYYTFVVADPLDWIVLGSFLVASLVAAQLLTRAQQRAEDAQERAVEVERLAALGAETLSAGRAEDALARIVEVIGSALGADCCEILVRRDAHRGGSGSGLLVSVARAGVCAGDLAETAGDDGFTATGTGMLAARVLVHGAPAAERVDGTTWIGAPVSPHQPLDWGVAGPDVRVALVPLLVRDRTVGVLMLAGTTPLTLDVAQRGFLQALSYYAALGVERVRLVAELERAESLRQVDAMRGALLAGVSHDLRTPLTTIKALASRLRERGSAEAATIDDEADRLNRLVGDLLDLSRLNAGAMSLRVELNAADDLIGAALQRVAGALDGRRVIVAAAAPVADGAEPPAAFGRFDFVQAQRALVNLLENAAKYGPRDQPIELAVERRDDRLRFRVADRGPGVTEGERERVFEPFYRAPDALPDVGGAGLGLAIARRLAVEQGGDVEYEPRPGGGSVFTLVLPAAEPAASTTDAAPV
jgi:two-component system sensor histidine kinase KdpD